MASISDKYQSQVKDYRETHFGDDPGMLRNIIFGLRSVFSSVKITDPSQGSATIRKSLLKTRQRVITLGSRKIDRPTTLLTRLRSLLSNPKPTPHLISAEEFKMAALNNDYSKYSGSVFIDGDLDLSDIPDITELPERLYVDGNLILSGCKKLGSLPQGKLRVSGSLVAENCKKISKVTKDMRIGEDISFKNCTQLSKIPRRLMNIGYRSDSKRRHIHLEKTDIRPCAPLDTEKRLFHFSSPLVSEITWWTTRADMDSDLPGIDLTDRESEHLREWLFKLSRSADFKNGTANFRKNYAYRVMKVLTDALDDPEYKDVIIRTIEIANSSCADRAALGLDDIEKLFLLKRAEKMIDAPDAEQQLRDLARQIMHLEMLENYVLRFLKGITDWGIADRDQIEIMLGFKTELRDTLNLPINVQYMNYPHYLLKESITRAGEIVISQSTPEALDDFLSNWEPWKKLKEKQSVPDYLALDTCPPPEDQECLILLDVTNEMVVLNGRPYDYESLKEWYVQNGTDPLTRERIQWSEVKRFSRSDVSGP